MESTMQVKSVEGDFDRTHMQTRAMRFFMLRICRNATNKLQIFRRTQTLSYLRRATQRIEGIPNVKSPIGNTDERRLRGAPKMFQNRSVSSPAADTTVLPSGLQARLNTRDVCPVNSFTLVMLDPLPYFQRIN